MAGMKSEFEMEMGKVKSYIKREKNRGEATIRKMELLQKDQYVSIQRDTMRMLRAIMHFRDHMLTCMEKEDLIDQAQTLYDLRDITDVKNCVIPAEELKTSAVDKRENLRRLKFAYDENKISHNLYQMSCAIIRKTMEIPQQKLHCFFEQYIAYRAVQDTKEHVLHILSEDEDLAADTREEMKQYMTMLDGRLNRIMRDWRSKMTSLEMEQGSSC
ncbi:hypothetical protein MAR_035077 [Mya arenaria]|uniref:FAM186A/B C-terminal domain-containing protein n=1 Tax=Mya arenaria TaxID=6604 RepID=A0ABY7ES30_MYAAR|nr:hypothetical protein MAR_035077 [Mya arenaria]